MESAAATPVPNLIHDPPSLPNTPHAKKIRGAETSASIAAALDDSRATPTPITMASHNLQEVTAPSETHLPPIASLAGSSDIPPPLQIQILTGKGRAPTRGSAFAAGYDIYSSEDMVVPGRGKAMVPTDIAIAVPAGTYGRIAPRSGLAAKHSIDTGAGVIDADYRGEVRVILFNFSDADFQIEAGDRIAQLIIERIFTPEVMVVEQLDASVRGVGGFGSTGGFAGGLPPIVG